MDYFGLLLLFCAGIVTIKKDIWGMCFFMAVRILIPENIRFIVSSISLNTAVFLCVFFVVLVKRCRGGKIKIASKSFPIFLLFLVIYFAIVLPISDFGDLLLQYELLIKYIITELLPPICLFICIKNKKDVYIFVKFYMIISMVCCVYGLLVVFLKGYNPYVFFLTKESQYLNTWKGLSSNSTFVSTNSFGYYLTMSFPFCFYVYKAFYKKRWVCILLILQVLCIIFSKKRSALICLVFYCFMYVLFNMNKRKTKMVLFLFGFSVFLFVISLALPPFKAMRDFVLSSLLFWNDNAIKGLTTSDLGSSWSLRVTQVIYPYVEIKDNLLFGHGFGWCSWYLEKHQLHWPLFGFETIFASGICEYGIMGFVVFFCIFYFSYKNIQYKEKSVQNYSLMFILTVLLMAIATGFNYYYLFFSLIVVMGYLTRYKKMEKH